MALTFDSLTSNDFERLRLLLSCLDVNFVNKNGKDNAITECTTELIDRAGFNTFYDLQQENKENLIKGMYILIKKGINKDNQNNNGMSALMHFVGELLLEAVQLLIENGAQINLEDSTGNNALHYLFLSKEFVTLHSVEHYAEICKELIEAGICINKQNNKGKTPLMLLVKCFSSSLSPLDQAEPYLSLIPLFIKSGANFEPN